MNASIVVSLSGEKVLTENFIYHLGKYKTINEYEVIFVNDYSDYKISKSFLMENNIINSKIIDLKEKVGYGKANNIAVDSASCNIIVFMNNDIILCENCLEILIDEINISDVAAVQPKLIYPQTNKIQSTGHTFTPYTNSHVFEGADIDLDIANIRENRQALTTAVCVTKKDLFYKMNKFDEIYNNAWEGMEYTLKLTQNGYTCLYNPKAKAYHFRGGTRCMYSINEQAQSAIFWSRWSSKISSDLHTYINKQILDKDKNNKFILLNFSKLTDTDKLFLDCDLKIINSIMYTFISGLNSVDLFKCIPTQFCLSETSYIYLTNNFTQIISNKIWFSTRKNSGDLIIDLSGNVVHL